MSDITDRAIDMAMTKIAGLEASIVLLKNLDVPIDFSGALAAEDAVYLMVTDPGDFEVAKSYIRSKGWIKSGTPEPFGHKRYYVPFRNSHPCEIRIVVSSDLLWSE